MANYHTEFCTKLSDMTDEEFAWLIANAQYKPEERQKVERKNMDPPWYDPDRKLVPFDTSADKDARTFSIESNGESSVDHACEFIKAFLAKFRPAKAHCLGWAATCDQNRPGAFGGGGAFITATEIKYNGSFNWLEQQVKRFNRKPPKHPVYVYRFELISAEPIDMMERAELAQGYDQRTPGATRVLALDGERVRRAETYAFEEWFKGET